MEYVHYESVMFFIVQAPGLVFVEPIGYRYVRDGDFPTQTENMRWVYDEEIKGCLFSQNP
jgi:hypothetical protein